MRIYGKLAFAVPALLLVSAACAKSPAANAGAGGSAPAAKATVVAVTQKEWAIEPAVSSVGPGNVTFQVTNQGQLTHEFVVLQTDAAPGSIPIESGKASEAGHQGEVQDVPPGTTKTLTLNLPPGNYVLICNLPGHYEAGMHAAFTVG